MSYKISHSGINFFSLLYHETGQIKALGRVIFRKMTRNYDQTHQEEKKEYYKAHQEEKKEPCKNT